MLAIGSFENFLKYHREHLVQKEGDLADFVEILSSSINFYVGYLGVVFGPKSTLPAFSTRVLLEIFPDLFDTSYQQHKLPTSKADSPRKNFHFRSVTFRVLASSKKYAYRAINSHANSFFAHFLFFFFFFPEFDKSFAGAVNTFCREF
jgi:hypothetical protein